MPKSGVAGPCGRSIIFWMKVARSVITSDSPAESSASQGFLFYCNMNSISLEKPFDFGDTYNNSSSFTLILEIEVLFLYLCLPTVSCSL